MKTKKKQPSVLVSIGQGLTTLIDLDDHERVSEYRWYAQASGTTKHYVFTWHKGRKLFLHRFLLNAPPGTFVDHINGNSLDNRKENLRYATISQNSCNRPKPKTKKSTSQFKGVSNNGSKKKPWRARITKLDREFNLGSFQSEIIAAAAYNGAAQVLHGRFARLNKVEGRQSA